MASPFRALRVPGFPQLGVAYSVNEFGNWFGEVALAILVLDATGSVMATAALFLAMEFIPALCGPALVARLEATGTRKALPVIYLAEAGAFAALALASDDFSLPLILFLAAVDGSLGLAARSLVRAIVAESLNPSSLLREGNALINIGYTAAAAAGPAIAGLLVAGGSPSTALFINAVSFALVAALMISAKSLPEVRTEDKDWFKRLRQGIAYIRGRSRLALVIVGNALAWLFLSSMTPVEVAYVKDSLGAGDIGYGVLLTCWGVGMLLGSVVFAAARKVALSTLVVGSTLVMGISIASMALAPNLVVASAAAAIAGLGNGVQWVAILSLVQELSDADYQARVVSLVQSATWIVPGVGFLMGGAIAAATTPRVSLGVAGVGVSLVVAVCVVLGARLGFAKMTAEP